MRKKAIGIDLGTTNSVLAMMKDGEPTIIPMGANDEHVLRSAVYFSEIDGKIRLLMGRDAIKRSLTRNAKVENFKYDFKRDMASNVESEAPDHTRLNSIILSAFVLNEFKKRTRMVSAELGLAEEITDAVITVPAYFSSSQRSATKTAGRLAGFNVLRIINEPTAAAIAYAHKRGVSGNVLVYDLGGGTFDVTVMRVENHQYDILATKGDHRMGGLKFDEAIRDLIIERLEAQGVNKTMLTEDQRMQLLLEAEKIKIQLSVSDEAFYEDEDGIHGVVITRDDFVARTQSLVQSTEMILRETVEQAHLTWDDIDSILLVGGSTRMPIIRQRIEEVTHQTPRYDLNPDTIVAEGASIIADLIVNQEVSFGETLDGEVVDQPQLIIHDVTSQGLGMFYRKMPDREYPFGGDYYNGFLLERNTPIPTTYEKVLYAAGDGQTKFQVRLTEGNEANPMFVKIILDKIMTLSQPRQKGQPLATILVHFDAEQIIHIRVIDSLTNAELESFMVQGSSIHTEEQQEEDISNLQAIFNKFIS